MSHIEIELFGCAAYASIVTDEDGHNQVFDTFDEVEKAAADCQDGLIAEEFTISLGKHSLEALKVPYFCLYRWLQGAFCPRVKCYFSSFKWANRHFGL
jgi:hypothetical protein